MPASHLPGRFALFCWEVPENNGTHDAIEYSENRDELHDRATALSGGGRFKRLELCYWDEGNWWIVERFPEEKNSN
jgi:hypothetical protein